MLWFVRNFLTKKSEIIQLTVFPNICRYEHFIMQIALSVLNSIDIHLILLAE
jgi:hypothetical protein